MTQLNAKQIVDTVKAFVAKFEEDHHDLDVEFNKLKRTLSKSGLKDRTSEECDEHIKALNDALEVVESKVSHTLTAMKDTLKQAKIDALEQKLKHCTCQNITMRQDHKRSYDNVKKSTDSGISKTSSTDSRTFSNPGDMLVVHPSDSQRDMVDIGENSSELELPPSSQDTE